MDGKVDYAKREFEQLKEKSDKIIKQFGCNPEQVKPKDLFGIFYDFASDFSEAFKKLQAKIKAEEEKMRKNEGKKKPRATVCEEDPKSVKDMIKHWKDKIAKAEALKDFGVKKKPQAEVTVVEVPKVVKKATKISRGNMQSGASTNRKRSESVSSSAVSEVSESERDAAMSDR